MRKSVLLSAFFLILLGCGKSLPSLEGIDLSLWKEDKAACKADRSKSISSLKDQKEKLKALSEMEIIELLGRPDQNELYTRNQKFFRYYLEPGPVCGNKKPDAKQLVIRFNAIGLANEVTVE